MINALQIMILIPLLKASIPANASMVFGQLTKVAAFDIFEIGDYVDEYFDLAPTDPVNEKFEAVGLETLYFLHNVGSFIFVILAYMSIMLTYVVLTLLGKFSTTMLRWATKIGEYLFWNSLITVIKESFLILTFCCLILLKYSFEFSPWGVAIQSILGMIIFAGYSYIPLKLLYNLAKNFKKTSDKEFTKQYGALYKDLKITNGRSVLLNPIVYFLRRVVICYLVVYGTDVLIY